MSGVYIMILLGNTIIKSYGPYPMTLAECSAKVELWTKFYLADPPLYPADKRWVYQCIERRSRL
jgi:hypothetical protein